MATLICNGFPKRKSIEHDPPQVTVMACNSANVDNDILVGVHDLLTTGSDEPLFLVARLTLADARKLRDLLMTAIVNSELARDSNERSQLDSIKANVVGAVDPEIEIGKPRLDFVNNRGE